jgi:hypothetical protein
MTETDYRKHLVRGLLFGGCGPGLNNHQNLSVNVMGSKQKPAVVDLYTAFSSVYDIPAPNPYMEMAAMKTGQDSDCLTEVHDVTARR